MNLPPQKDQDKIFSLRCKGKRGQYLSPEEMKYAEKMYKQYPEYYTSLNKAVFEETHPNPKVY